jgi:hypothetical protein
MLPSESVINFGIPIRRRGKTVSHAKVAKEEEPRERGNVEELGTFDFPGFTLKME